MAVQIDGDNVAKKKRQPERNKAGFFGSLLKLAGRFWNKEVEKEIEEVKESHETKVYFISGMCYNCEVFDKLHLPKGYLKIYLEWYIPRPDESLNDYARRMAETIDTTQPFILIGYSFGAVIMQEMTNFMKPDKCVIISSFKSKKEIPVLFKAVHKTNLVEILPKRLFASSDFVTNAFNHLVYNASNADLAEYMTYTDPVYIKWAVEQITQWEPDNQSEHLYHIHGTADQIFPYDRLENVFPIEGGDHLMVLKKAEAVSSVLDSILLMKVS